MTKAFRVDSKYLDAAESIFFSRQLERERAQAMEIRYADTIVRRLIPVDNEVSPTTDVVTYRVYDGVGAAKIIASYADDIPRVDVFAREVLARVKDIGVGFGYSFMEVRKAAAEGANLPDMKAVRARRATEELLERVAATGDSQHQLLGLLNQPNVPFYVIPNGAGGSPRWNTKTAAEILADLNGLGASSVNATRGIERPDTLILTEELDAIIRSTPMGTGLTTTIREFFLANHPSIRTIETWERLKGAGVGGVTRIVAYRRAPDVLRLLVPQEFEMLDPQSRNYEEVVPCHARTGGVQVFLPLAMTYADGAAA